MVSKLTMNSPCTHWVIIPLPPVTRVLRGVLIGSLANRSALDGIDVFPNLGYKKDAFLEPSLVSNNFPLYPTNPHPPFLHSTPLLFS